MKPSVFLACAIAAVGAAGMNGATAAPAKTSHHVPARPSDWTKVVRPTAEGGFVMGNPDAPVKLVEYGSMTCPHCRAFDSEGVPTLVGKYVKSGQVSWEFRNYVRDAFDMSAALIARCAGTNAFFPLSRTLFHEQPNWVAKIQAAPEDQLKSVETVPLNRRFLALARIAGLQQLAATNGLPAARSTQCLSNEKAVKQLADMDAHATTQFPDFAGTPTFILNGKMLERTATWDALEPQLKAALGTRGQGAK